MSEYPFHPYAPGGAADHAAARYSSSDIDLIAARYAGDPFPYSSAPGSFDAHAGARRTAEVLYHQSIMERHSTIGQNEALYSSNTMVKRPRLESSLPIYPQRPGEKDCSFYMMTRTCKYGEACKFDHPLWVPEGGIPNWKEEPNLEESYPERPGEPDCPFFMRSSKCKFGSRCKFNHPKGKVAGTGGEEPVTSDSFILPVRPSEPLCSFYAKTGKCRFGAKCKFNHPKDIEIASNGKESEHMSTVEVAENDGAADVVSEKKFAPVAQEFNSKGMPIRPGEVDCPFYIKTGSCMYGSTCRFSHPDRHHRVLDFPLAGPLGQSIFHTAGTTFPPEMLNPAANFLHTFDFHAPLVPFEPEPITYPQRPGETVCDFYMKTGHCKFSEKCKFHHPVDRSAPDHWVPPQKVVTLTLAGLPRREDAEVCSFYMRTGTCKYGAHCKFDHPPPVEALAKLSKQGASEENEDGNKNPSAGLSYVLEH